MLIFTVIHPSTLTYPDRDMLRNLKPIVNKPEALWLHFELVCRLLQHLKHLDRLGDSQGKPTVFKANSEGYLFLL